MDFRKLYANRIGGQDYGLSNVIYKFEKIKRAKIKAIENNPNLEILDFGVGEPDKMAPQLIRDHLKISVDNPENRGYADNGTDLFLNAASLYMKKFYNVDLDHKLEINHSIGIKSALSMLPLAFINPGDIIFQTVPGYPVMATHTKYLGGEVVDIPLLEENKFLPDIKNINPDLANKCKLFYINYPNNPTGAIATNDFYDELISFAIHYNILIIQDAPYSTLIYSNNYSSILQRPNAKECCLELHSMSKGFNMTGWRLGFFCGAAWAVKALSDIKDNSDSGQFKAIQEAAAKGIVDMHCAKSISNHYERRLNLMVDVLSKVGFNASMPGGTFYLYLKAPKSANGFKFNSAEEAAIYLIEKFGISTVPWDNTGPYLRFGAVFESKDDEDDIRVLSVLEKRLIDAKLEF